MFFDNVQVTHERGAILDETHYYPFGLMMEAISSRAAGGLKNTKRYNGNELQENEFIDESGLDLYDFNARTYDQQIGRFLQQDPLDDHGGQESLTPYHFCGNNPAGLSDPSGKCAWCTAITDGLKSTLTTVVATVAVVVDNVMGSNSAGVIADNGYVPSSQTGTWNNAVTIANRSSQTIGTVSILTGGVMVGGAVGAMAGTGGISSPVALPVATAGIGAIALGSQLTMNATENLANGDGLIRDQNAGSSSTVTKTTKKDRVADQKPGERALNQSEGINNAQSAATKHRAPGQKKQTKITSTRKSDDYLKRELKEVRTLKDAFENFGQ